MQVIRNSIKKNIGKADEQTESTTDTNEGTAEQNKDANKNTSSQSGANNEEKPAQTKKYQSHHPLQMRMQSGLCEIINKKEPML